MAGIAKDGQLYPANGVYGIDDTKTSLDTGWSSSRVMKEIKPVADILDTPIVFDDGVTNYELKTTVDDANYYYVENGICYMHFNVVSGFTINTGNRIEIPLHAYENVYNYSTKVSLPIPVRHTPTNTVHIKPSASLASIN